MSATTNAPVTEQCNGSAGRIGSGGAKEAGKPPLAGHFVRKGLPRRLRGKADFEALAEAFGIEHVAGIRSFRAHCIGHDGDGLNCHYWLDEDDHVVAHCFSRGCSMNVISDAARRLLDEGRRLPRSTAIVGAASTFTPPSREWIERVTDRLRHDESDDLARKLDARGWSARRGQLADLGVGYATDGDLLTIGVSPIGARPALTFIESDMRMRVCGVTRYRPDAEPTYRKRAIGKRGLWLPGGRMPADDVVFVFEGGNDAADAALAGLPAIGAPSATIWRREWSGLFVGRRLVTVVFDADDVGREGAERVVASLRAAGVKAAALDPQAVWS